MAPQVSKETAITAAIVAGIAVPVLAVGIYNRRKAQELVSAGYTSASSTASAAVHSVKSGASKSYSSIASSLSCAWEGTSKKLKLKRVKSFPIITEEEEFVEKKKGKKAAKQQQSVQLTATAS